ncbi:urea amidolyase associated protein UAAP2 [Nitrosospira briensis]|uniref:urea amidolyase associated protein UAAP2 n=1 Tax=Nitrosospira briensis TaxID=35799 RepID=UPI00046B0623|nr:urea amidolyase associated protein UAAP2 [Nitrosospira briensis]
MSKKQFVESRLDPETATVDEVCPAGEPWVRLLTEKQVFRIVDLGGNQAVDTLFYNASHAFERYSATDTIRRQKQLYLTTGSKLYSNFGNVMLSIVADTCGRHDTIGGACAAESNTVRYGLEKFPMHSCRDNFLHALAHEPVCEHLDMSKRDLPSNINFFMNVPVSEAGGLEFADGMSAPFKYVEMRAEMDVIVLISNCPQLNNPCNAYNPTPIRLLIWDDPEDMSFD